MPPWQGHASLENWFCKMLKVLLGLLTCFPFGHTLSDLKYV